MSKPSKKTKSSTKNRGNKLAPRVELFVAEYIKDRNGTQAAIRAGYSARSAEMQASRMLSKDKIRRAVDEAIQKQMSRLNMEADDVIRHWTDIATADARELVEYRRFACRYCWGKNHAYQWRTRREFEAALQEAKDHDRPLPTDEGGYGYTTNGAQNPECPECDGVGEGRMIMKDTRGLKRGAALLYAGTQIGKDGLKVLMEDRSAALVNIAKHMGLLDPKITLKGDKKNPLQMLIEQVQGSALKPKATPGDAED